MLNAAEKLRNGTPEQNSDSPRKEDEFGIVLKALRDINLPKFVSGDIESFENILKDLFPEVESPDVKRDALVKAIEEKCKDFR